MLIRGLYCLMEERAEALVIGIDKSNAGREDTDAIVRWIQ